jgi:hypothetical protein
VKAGGVSACPGPPAARLEPLAIRSCSRRDWRRRRAGARIRAALIRSDSRAFEGRPSWRPDHSESAERFSSWGGPPSSRSRPSNSTRFESLPKKASRRRSWAKAAGAARASRGVAFHRRTIWRSCLRPTREGRRPGNLPYLRKTAESNCGLSLSGCSPVSSSSGSSPRGPILRESRRPRFGSSSFPSRASGRPTMLASPEK